MKKNPQSSSSSTASKIDPAFLPQARVLIKKIKAKLVKLKSDSSKNTPKKSPPKSSSSRTKKKGKARAK